MLYYLVHTHIHTHTYTHIYTNTHTYTHIHTYTHTHIYTHTHTHALSVIKKPTPGQWDSAGNEVLAAKPDPTLGSIPRIPAVEGENQLLQAGLWPSHMHHTTSVPHPQLQKWTHTYIYIYIYIYIYRNKHKSLMKPNLLQRKVSNNEFFTRRETDTREKWSTPSG
jgi:hypothetical protein